MNLEGESLEDYHRLKEMIFQLVFDRADEFTSKKTLDVNGSFRFQYEFARPDVAKEVSNSLGYQNIALELPIPESAPFVCRYKVADLISSAASIAWWSIVNNKTIHAKWIPAPNIDPVAMSLGNHMYLEIVNSIPD